MSHSTPLVELRPWSEDDFGLLTRLLGDPAMTEHLDGPESPDKLRERHERYLGSGKPFLGQMLVIVVGKSRLAAGSIGYWDKEWQGELVWETGYSVLPEFQGQGIATRATRLVLERARLEGRFRYVHAFPSAENAASNAVCRSAGFLLQGACDFEYPKGHIMQCNDWSFDLLAAS